jgi:WhiB family redox-sensing transcriptional regulator
MTTKTQPVSIRDLSHLDWGWQKDGLCRGHDTEIFFLDYNMRGEEKRKKIEKAKSICNACPVKKECLDHSLSAPEIYGVWGGLSEDERILLLRGRGWKYRISPAS